MKTKRCNRCKKRKPVAQYNKDRTRKDGLDNCCKPCAADYLRAYKERIGLAGRQDMKLRERYGISIQEYNQKLEDQNHRCAICARTLEEIHSTSTRRFALAVDHDHTTDKVRGLLCSACNKGIGLLQDDVDVLLKAHTYLVKHKEENHGRKDHERVVTEAGIRPAKNARQVQTGSAKDPRKASQ
jgi:hypothetical protein